MARSQYVYLVYMPSPFELVAAFTVKHELETWLRREEGQYGYKVVRLRDGGAKGATHMEVAT